MVKKAAKLAVYVDVMINVKNHQLPAASLAEVALQLCNRRIIERKFAGGHSVLIQNKEIFAPTRQRSNSLRKNVTSLL